MPYSELVKDFGPVRDLMREFYLYGFKKRSEFSSMSARTYDDERRRLESWLGGCMGFTRTPEGKNVFISVNTRSAKENPLYAAWKARSFTDGDITLHFILFDTLPDPGTALTLREIMDAIDQRQAGFDEAKMFDVSTVRKKLQEYIREGIITAEKKGRELRYRRAEAPGNMDGDALKFFSETAPCGVIGSFLQDKEEKREGPFTFKHHYITAAMDSEIVYTLLRAMRTQTKVKLTCFRRDGDAFTETVTPLQILCGVQNGRQYLMCARTAPAHIDSLRIDYITAAEPTGETDPDFDRLRTRLQVMRTHMFGTNTGDGRTLYEVGFTVRFSADEPYIYQRLLREKRCGSVERLDEGSARFTATVYDASELIPWIRTFICRIVQFHCEDKAWENRFNEDLAKMYALYENGGDAK